MGIVDEDVARVREMTDAVQVVGEHVGLKKVGRRWTGLCPFHAERSPSFSLNAEEGLWYCFGCQAKGDIISFVREIEHLDFVEAVERLASRAGITLRYDKGAEGRDRQKRERLYEAMERAVEYYHQRLLSGKDAAPARGYLRSRGYDGEVVRKFRIGWAPDEWDALARHLDVDEAVLRDTGLGFVNRMKKRQDAFRARVMFPILDNRDRTIAFGGRRLEGGEGPKYKNSADTVLYAKSRTLYGLNWAKSEIVTSGEAVVCEGYTDVIGLHQAGVPQAVATCGTALTEEHIRMLRNFARRVVLAYDADAAGQAAAERFYEWEQKLDLDLAVVSFPQGTDPGDMARRDPAGLKKAVGEARSFLGFRLDRVLEASDLRTNEGRARGAAAAMQVVAEHPDPLVRDQYLMEVADRTRLAPERLRELANVRRRLPAGTPAPARAGAPANRQPEPPGGRPARRGPELEALRLMAHRREQVEGLLHEMLFADELYAAAYIALREAGSIGEALEIADPGAAALLQRIAVEDADADPADVAALLARSAAMRRLSELEAEARQSERAGEIAAVVGWLKLSIEELDENDTRAEATDRLVAWLAERPQEGL
ncbi:MAG TPA: DNA primase [Acidimicrobiales bacterium]|nr:DNA primase [Acidimicrobiales bacterium]